jgi:hypothetical protein
MRPDTRAPRLARAPLMLHAPARSRALSLAHSRADAPLLAPAARAIALQATGLRATPTGPPGVLGSLREDLSNVQ